ncbi:MAG: hypothetical protein A2176_05505 [Spirochaetes bacterium RBG_13_51_14]|nr:MAG: hypothetical protein A2176_05505 [Spirochaetes bacterium RBG_13_51_14]
MVICSGGIANNNFFVDFYVNNQVIFNFSPPGPAGVTNKSILPIGHRGKATITATKEDDNASLTILVYKDSKIDKFSNLSACNTTTGTCSNTLVLTYDVDDESNLTKTAAGTTETEEESSSSSSSE